jgi:acyl-CoA synthetase (AMP-forming)/AMP-acid ligase II
VSKKKKFHNIDDRVLGVVGAGTSVKIIDPESGEVLGPNQVGEIMAKSDNVMKGYLNRPGMTIGSKTSKFNSFNLLL